jgi:EmrB/QacA subfamily drug resistance transporter
LSHEASETRPALATAALLLGTALAALELNVVGTAMPTLVAQLGGLRLYGLVFSAYLLTSTVTLPLYGRLADLRGRKPVYLVAIALFVLGSGLCGTAPSMAALVGFRALQGLGAGGVVPITMTIFGDLYPAERRALVQGLFSTVWGVSSVLGPLVGGFLVTYVSWRWVFWVNLPTGLLAAALFLTTYHERVEREADAPGLDLKGTLLLSGCLVCLIVGLQGIEGGRTPSSQGDVSFWGGEGWSWLLLGCAGVLGALFLRHERRAAAPLIPLGVFRDRAMSVTWLAGLPLGGVLFGVVTFVPLFVQGVLHGSPTQAGLALVPLSVVWTGATFATGPLSRWLGFRPVVILGSLCCAAGTAGLLLWAGPGPGRHGAMVVVGAGMGLNLTASIIAVQDAMPWHHRGVATALLQFSRVIGGMIAVTTLGALVTARFARGTGPHLPDGVHPGELLDPARWPALAPQTLELARRALTGAVRLAFWAMVGLGAAVLLINLAFPSLRVKNSGSQK